MSTTNIYKALAEFQQEVPVIHKDTQGYGYTYADLPKILEIINPLLKKHGLGFTQPIDGNYIKTVLFHSETGETIESAIAIPEGVQLKGMNDFQVLGSAITYLRRYALSSILGLVADKDTDAQGKQKQVLAINSQDWKKIVKAIEEGKTVTLEQVKSRYIVSKELELELENLNIF